MRKKYAFLMNLPENDFSSQCLQGAAKAAEDIDADLYVFSHGLIDGLYSDHESNIYRYQYNTVEAFLDAEFLDGALVEYGTIVSDASEEKKASFREKFADIPVVLMAEDAEGFRSVGFDNEAGLRDALRHLVEVHGCRRIGFFSGPENNHDAQARLAVYRDMVKEYDLPVDDTWVGYGNFSPYCHDELKRLMTLHPDIEALAFGNDGMAECAYEVMPELGRTIGSDIFITGFDDTPQAVLSTPSLTSVKADPSEMAYRAMMILDGREECSGAEHIPSRLVVRQSCGCGKYVQCDTDGSPMGTDADEEFRRVALEKINSESRTQMALGEHSFILREVVFNRDSDEGWMKTLMKSLRRIGATEAYMLMYEQPVVHDPDDEWKIPDRFFLRACMHGDASEVYGPSEKAADKDHLDELLDEYGSGRRNCLVVPLFYRNQQLGLLCTVSDCADYQYIYRMAGLISNTITMAQVQAESVRYQNQLLLASQAKTQFLANMSHEVRTPINAITGMDEMILRESTEPAIREYASEIRSAADSLLFLVNGILDLTRIEAGKMELIPVDYSLSELVDEVMRQMSYRKGSKDIKLVTDISEGLPLKLYGDDNRIRQILINLLTNAVKYTEKGSVTLKITGETKDGYADLCFSVKDTGIGIKPEDLGKLFEKFERIEERRNRNIEGVGLGMNITVGLLELMDSRLNVQSVYGEGSEFFFTIRQKVIDSEPAADMKKHDDAEKKAHSGKYRRSFTSPDSKILIVDDNAVNRKVISHLLKATGIVTREAENGQVCLEKMAGEDFDLVLLDHMMPVMDGMQTLERIKSDPGYTPGRPPVVALTANAIKGVEKQYLDSGFDAYLSKPVMPAALEEVLLRFLPPEKIIKEQ